MRHGWSWGALRVRSAGVADRQAFLDFAATAAQRALFLMYAVESAEPGECA